MSDHMDTELEKRLSEIASDAASATPLPSDVLLQRILSDAADTAVLKQPAESSPTTRRPRWPSLRPIFPVWTSGAFAMMALGLMVGLSLGYGYGDPAMAVQERTTIGDFAYDFDDSFVVLEGPF
ncbi:MAG: hypothetical protein AAF526_10570 [Pseudomonadota bacterium]